MRRSQYDYLERKKWQMALVKCFFFISIKVKCKRKSICWIFAKLPMLIKPNFVEGCPSNVGICLRNVCTFLHLFIMFCFATILSWGTWGNFNHLSVFIPLLIISHNMTWVRVLNKKPLNLISEMIHF